MEENIVRVLVAAVGVVLLLASAVIAIPKTGVQQEGLIKVTVYAGTPFNTELDKDVSNDFYFFLTDEQEPTLCHIEITGDESVTQFVKPASEFLTVNPDGKPVHMPLIISVPESYAGQPVFRFQVSVSDVQDFRVNINGSVSVVHLIGSTSRIYEVTVSNAKPLTEMPSQSPTPLALEGEVTSNAILGNETETNKTNTETPLPSVWINDEPHLLAAGSVQEKNNDSTTWWVSGLVLVGACVIGYAYLRKRQQKENEELIKKTIKANEEWRHSKSGKPRSQ